MLFLEHGGAPPSRAEVLETFRHQYAKRGSA
jgi:hypothetical protein